MKKSENYKLSKFENVIFETIKLRKITIPKKASFWREAIKGCSLDKESILSRMELVVYFYPQKKELFLSIGSSYHHKEDSYELLTEDEFYDLLEYVCKNYVSKTGDEPLDYLSINIEIFWSLVKDSIVKKLEGLYSNILLMKDIFWTEQDTVSRMGSRFIFSEFWEELNTEIQKSNLNLYTNNIFYDKGCKTSFLKDNRALDRVELFYKSVNKYFIKNLDNLSNETFDIVLKKLLYLSNKAPSAKNETIRFIEEFTTIQDFVLALTNVVIKRINSFSDKYDIYNQLKNCDYEYLANYVNFIDFFDLTSYFEKNQIIFPDVVVDKIPRLVFNCVTLKYFVDFLKTIKSYDLSRLNDIFINVESSDDYYSKWKVIEIILKNILFHTNEMLRINNKNKNVLLNFRINLEKNKIESQNSDDIEIEVLSKLPFIEKILVFKDKNRIVILPKNNNINNVIVDNIAFTK